MKRFVAGEVRKLRRTLSFGRVVRRARDSARSQRTNELDRAPCRILADAPMNGADAEGDGGIRIPMLARLLLQLGDA